MSYLQYLVNTIKQVARKARGVVRHYVPIDEQTRRFIEHNKNVWANWENKNCESEILVEFYSISISHIVYSYFLNALAGKHNASVKVFSRWDPYRSNPKLYAIYQSFNIVGSVVSVLSQDQETLKESIYQEVIQSIKTKKDVFELRVLNVWIGVEIYETYLRAFGKPTVNLDDPKLFDLISDAIGLLVFWKDYLESNKVVAVVVSHGILVDCGILCELAYQKNIPVYLPDMIRLTYADSPFPQSLKFQYFRELFKTLSAEEQLDAIELGKKQIERRLAGEIVDMYYATESAFRRSKRNNSGVRKSDKIQVLIATHCFFDNPHSWGGMLFVDFYEWLCYLGKISECTNYDWYIKVHPNPLPETEKVVREILDKFPNITLIPSDISHHELVEAGINFVLTCYGTVGHEYPALGVQVINAGFNPQIAYDFNWHPKSLQEYEDYLLNLDKLDKKINLEDIYEFYYMYYYYFRTQDLYVNDFNQLQADLKPNESIGPEAYSYFLNQLTDTRHKNIIATLSGFLDSGMRELSSHGPVLPIDLDRTMVTRDAESISH